jgi:hypothetical protein
MSRNLCRRDCRECPGGHEHILLEEAPRPATADDVGAFQAAEYAGLIVAAARCVLCHTLYLAWVDWPGTSYCGAAAARNRELSDPRDQRRFVDLSYRDAFNDEPSPEDTPLFKVEAVVTYVRTPMKVDDHSYRRSHSETRTEYDDWRDASVEKWRKRAEEAAVRKLSPADEMAAAKGRTT